MSESVEAYVPVDDDPFLRDCPVFDEARRKQEWLDTQEFNDVSHASSVGASIIHDLDGIARSDKYMLLGEIATIAASTILIPRMAQDITGNGSFCIYSEEISTDPDNMFDIPRFTGAFMGFNVTLTADATENDVKEKTIYTNIRPKLQYQILASERVDPANFSGNLYAYSAVDISSIEFMSDTRRDDTQSALNMLTRTTTESHQIFLHELVTLLAGDEIEPKNIRTSGKIIRKFLDEHSADTPNSYKDAILDFVSARLRLYFEQSFLISSASALSTSGSNSKAKNLIKPLRGVYEVNGLTFASHYTVASTNDRRTRLSIHESEHAIAIAVSLPEDEESESSIVHVPLEKIVRLLLN